MKKIDVTIIGAGPAGIGISAMLKDLGVMSQVVLERRKIGESFNNWPKEMKLITPSFTTNFYGHLDLNSIISATSPAYTLRKEHPSGQEYAKYLKAVSEYYKLPIIEDANVDGINYSNNLFTVKIEGTELIESRYVIWASGEFHYPKLKTFKGAELCIHNSHVRSWDSLEGNEFYIIGGFESGIDAAVNLSRLGKKVNVLDRNAPWGEHTTDPSISLSPFTLERLREQMDYGRINLIEKTDIKNVIKKGSQYFIKVKGETEQYISETTPILATGFKSSLGIIKNLFDWDNEKSYALLTDDDESTKTPGLFLVGPQVRHENLIFCFIYKYRQRFGVVANSIGNRLGLDTAVLEQYRHEGLYLDDLSCCGDECEC
jgi:thioredoxin reductase